MSINYLETYKKRLSHMGTTPQEKAFNSGILEFRRYLKYNQHVVSGLRVWRNAGAPFRGAILTDKEDENRVSQILLVELGVDIKPGDFIQWNDGAPWLVYRSTTSSYQPYQKFHMVRCNYEVKWVDENGTIQQSWVYLLGHKDSKVKDNFRTWNNLITPQPNKYIEMVLPHTKIPLGTDIMVLDEVWRLVEYDQNSVPGVIYLSFTETTLNEQRDDLKNKLASADKVAEWELELPAVRQVRPHERFEVKYSLRKNGIEQYDVKPTISVNDAELSLDGDVVVAGASGGGMITVSYNDLVATQEVHIVFQSSEPLVIAGNEKVRAGRESKYQAGSEKNVVEFSLIQEEELATIVSSENNTCVIKANSKNKLGTVTLVARVAATAKTAALEATRTIEIVPLWQVI